jgi:hypothetical protein
MGNADGSLKREEFHKIGGLSKKYIDAQEANFNQVISASLDWYLDQTNF